MEKREPLMLDRYLALGGVFDKVVDKKFSARMKDDLREAKRFVLDLSALQYLADYLDEPERLAEDQEFALRPFENMYVEIPGWIEFFRMTNGIEADLDADSVVGYYFRGPVVYVFSEGKIAFGPTGALRTDAVTMMPICYRLNVPMSLEHELSMVEDLSTSRAQFDAMMWGGTSYTRILKNDKLVEVMKSSSEGIKLNVDQSALDALDQHTVIRALRANHSIEWVPHMKPKELMSEKTLRGLVASCSGDLRNALGILVMLNRGRQYIYEEALGPKQKLIRNKPSALVSHSIVRIRVDAPPLKLVRGGSGGVWRREHDVRGHFCYSKRARLTIEQNPSHEHGWTEVTVNRWFCPSCKGLKWWRKEHRRGHREKGKVVTTYEVTE